MRYISFPPKFGEIQIVDDGDEVLINDSHLLRLEENESLRTRFEDGIKINRAIVERLKRENKDYFFMEKSVEADEQFLKEVLLDAKKEVDKL